MSRKYRNFHEFGAFRLSPEERQLFKDGKPVPLTPKAIEVLVLLVENSGSIVSKDELMQKVWPDSFVEEGNLAVNISTLRKALGDGSSDQQYIETVPKRGYRFVKEVTQVNEQVSVPVAQPLNQEKTTEAPVMEEVVDLSPAAPTAPDPKTVEPAKVEENRRSSFSLTIVAALAVVLLGVVVLGIWRARSHSNPKKILSVKTLLRLTNNPADDWQPDISPDGSKIVFVSNRDGKGEIYIMDADGSNQRNLTNNPANDDSPAWSPDGSMIAFQSDREGTVCIYIMNADGSNVRRVTTNPGARADWSHDGKRIAFS